MVVQTAESGACAYGNKRLTGVHGAPGLRVSMTRLALPVRASSQTDPPARHGNPGPQEIQFSGYGCSEGGGCPQGPTQGSVAGICCLVQVEPPLVVR